MTDSAQARWGTRPPQTTDGESPCTERVAPSLVAPELSGERTYTPGEVALVEGIVQLEVLQATRGGSASVPPPEGMAAWTFLVRFTWDGREPAEFATGEPYYNAIGFTMRDDEGFEYPTCRAISSAASPPCCSGTSLPRRRRVRGADVHAHLRRPRVLPGADALRAPALASGPASTPPGASSGWPSRARRCSAG